MITKVYKGDLKKGRKTWKKRQKPLFLTIFGQKVKNLGKRPFS